MNRSLLNHASQLFWIVFLLSGACMRLMAGVNSWTPIGPEGGYTRGLEFHPTRAGVMYSVVENNFYRSTNSGASWTASTKVFTDILTGLVVDRTNGDTVYAFEINVGLWRSLDQGATFTFLGPAGVETGIIGLAISGDGTRLLAASANGKLMISDDRGAHWSDRTPTPTPPLTSSYFVQLTIDPTNRDILYASMLNGGVFKSTNGGLAWTQLWNGPAGALQQFSIVVDPADHNHLLMSGIQVLESHDGGSNWSLVYGAAGPVAAIDSHDSNKIYVGAISNNIFRTVDAGVHWDLFNTNDGVSCGWFTSILIDPIDSNHIIGAGDEGICSSTDAGTTWHPSSSGIYATRVESLRSAPGADRRILVGLSPGPAFLSSNKEGPWTRLDNATFRAGGAPSGTTIVAFSPTSPKYKWLIGVRTGGIRVTTDAGTSWATGDSPSIFYDLSADIAASETYFAATYYGIYKSTDGGFHWLRTNTPANFLDFRAVAVDPANTAVLYAGAGSLRGAAFGIVKSIDGGLNWSESNTGINTESVNRIAVRPTDSSVVYAGTNSGLYRSINYAQSWTRLDTLDHSYSIVDDVTLDPVNPDIMYTVHGILERSVDRGQSWEKLYDAGHFEARHVALDNLSPNIVYLGTYGRGVQALEIAPDLTLTATAPTSNVPQGTSARIIYQLQNQGPFAATSVALSGVWPAAAATATVQSSRGSCAQSNGTFTCLFGALRTGENITITFDFSPSSNSFSVDASASAYEPDPISANNSVHSPITSSSIADVAVNVSSSTTSVDSGQTLVLSTVISNSGPSTANDVNLVQQLGTLFSASNVTTTRGSCTTSGSQITCALGTIQSGTSVTITTTVLANAVGSASIAAQTSTSTTESDAMNNSGSVAITVRSANTPPAGGGGGAISFDEIIVLMILLRIARRRERFTQRTVQRANHYAH